MKKVDFQAFYEKHIDKVYRFVYFRVNNNKSIAEDLTSEIFMKALKAFDTYDVTKSESSWILTIARNHVYNHYRDKKNTADIEEIEFSIKGEDGIDLQERNDDIRRLNESLHKLSKKDRKLIELKHIQGYRYKDIAGIIGKSSAACRIELHRAMKKLKNLMKKYDDS